jgi:hypothetical protein
MPDFPFNPDWIIAVQNRSGGKPALVCVVDGEGQVVGVAESTISTEAALLRAFGTARAGGLPGLIEFAESQAIPDPDTGHGDVDADPQGLPLRP